MSRTNTIGLVLSALLGLGSVVAVALPAPDPGEPGPPLAVILASSALGLLTLIAAVLAWRTRHRIWSRLTAGSQVLSIMLGLPAFFVPGLPAWLVAVSGAMTVAQAAAVFLVLQRPSRG